ncbi:MAG: hypothetical protein HQL75_05865, partial [Magnetococcales bacterium]|nr:hypothetical protein [Magnetococcales bacterium]
MWSIRKFDQGTDVLSGAYLVMPLKNVVANDLKESFQLLFGDRVRITGGEKDSHVAVVVGQLSLLDRASVIIQRFDDASAPASDHDVLDISNELVRKIDTRLRSVLGDSVGIAPNPWTRQILVKGTPSQRLVARSIVDMMDKPRSEVRQVVRLHRLVASDVVPVISELAEASVIHSAGSAEILIVGPSVEVRKLVEVVRDLDGGREQVRVDAIVAVLSDDGLHTLGTRLDVKEESFLRNFVAEGLSISGPNLLLDLVGGPVGFGVEASSRESSGRVLSSPSLTVLDGNKASILVGQNIP